MLSGEREKSAPRVGGDLRFDDKKMIGRDAIKGLVMRVNKESKPANFFQCTVTNLFIYTYKYINNYIM